MIAASIICLAVGAIRVVEVIGCTCITGLAGKGGITDASAAGATRATVVTSYIGITINAVGILIAIRQAGRTIGAGIQAALTGTSTRNRITTANTHTTTWRLHATRTHVNAARGGSEITRLTNRARHAFAGLPTNQLKTFRWITCRICQFRVVEQARWLDIASSGAVT